MSQCWNQNINCFVLFVRKSRNHRSVRSSYNISPIFAEVRALGVTGQVSFFTATLGSAFPLTPSAVFRCCTSVVRAAETRCQNQEQRENGIRRKAVSTHFWSEIHNGQRDDKICGDAKIAISKDNLISLAKMRCGRPRKTHEQRKLKIIWKAENVKNVLWLWSCCFELQFHSNLTQKLKLICAERGALLQACALRIPDKRPHINAHSGFTKLLFYAEQKKKF